VRRNAQNTDDQELILRLSIFTGQLSLAEGMAKGMTLDTFKHMDADSNGYISFTEFQQWTESQAMNDDGFVSGFGNVDELSDDTDDDDDDDDNDDDDNEVEVEDEEQGLDPRQRISSFGEEVSDDENTDPDSVAKLKAIHVQPSGTMVADDDDDDENDDDDEDDNAMHNDSDHSSDEDSNVEEENEELSILASGGALPIGWQQKQPVPASQPSNHPVMFDAGADTDSETDDEPDDE
jgi:hypothetical protein